MRRFLLKKLAARFEGFLGVELPYLYSVIEHAPGAVFPIVLSMPSANYGKSVPAPVLHMARLGATKAQDCGECLQIAVNVALQEDVSANHIEAVLTGRQSDSPSEYVDAFEFGSRVGAGFEADELRSAMRDRYSERGLIELSMAAAGAQFFPVLKRGMGFAEACDIAGLSLNTHSTKAA